MRIVFMGTPAFAVPSLKALAAAHDVALVLTQPDAVRGRGRVPVPSEVKAAAVELGISIVEASRITDEVFSAVAAAAPDIVCVAAYGCLLPQRVLDVAPLGCVNVHASLLPRWRGAAPIQRAILAGDELVGVSIMRMEAGLDTGAWCRQAAIEVGEWGAERVISELAEVGARELVAALDEIAAGTAVWHEQDESLVTYASKIQKAEMLLNPADTARENLLRVRASSDAAPARANVCGRGVRVLEACEAAQTDAPPAAGTVAVDRHRVLLGCADTALDLLVVKPDGKRQMAASAWAQGLGKGGTWEPVS